MLFYISIRISVIKTIFMMSLHFLNTYCLFVTFGKTKPLTIMIDVNYLESIIMVHLKSKCEHSAVVVVAGVQRRPHFVDVQRLERSQVSLCARCRDKYLDVVPLRFTADACSEMRSNWLVDVAMLCETRV